MINIDQACSNVKCVPQAATYLPQSCQITEEWQIWQMTSQCFLIFGDLPPKNRAKMPHIQLQSGHRFAGRLLTTCVSCQGVRPSALEATRSHQHPCCHTKIVTN